MKIFYFDILEQCETIGGPSSGSKCKFPFIFASETYNECTNDGGIGDFWCATDLDGSGEMINGKWGICSDDCDKHGKSSKKMTISG